MRLLIILIFLSGLGQFSQAQNLRVVKDNINCTYGLKDQAGNWVVEASYILIQEFNSGYFLVKDALGDGLFSPSGKQIYECKYEELGPIQPQWRIVSDYSHERYRHPLGKGFFFQAKVGGLEVILNSRGKQIFQLSTYDRVQFDGEGYMLIYGGGPLTSTYLDTSGNVLMNKIPGAILPFGENEFSLHGKGIEGYSEVVRGDVRLINHKGEYPREEQFDRAILASDNRICYEMDGKYGEITTAGIRLIEPKYKCDKRLSSAPVGTNSWQIYNDKKQVGLMKSDGTVLLEPLYDRIDRMRMGKEFEAFWSIQKDGSFGVIENDGKTVIPLSYDKIHFVHSRMTSRDAVSTSFIVEREGQSAYISPKHSLNPGDWYDKVEIIGESDYQGVITAKCKLMTQLNGKFGLLNLDGSLMKECIYDQHCPNTTKTNRHFFSKGLDLFMFNFGSFNTEGEKCAVSSTTENSVIFSNPPYFITGIISENKKEFTRLSIRGSSQQVFGNMMVLSQEANVDWKIINVNTQEEIVIPYVAEIRPFRSNKFLFTTRYSQVGILDEDGNILVSPVYSEFRQNYESSHLWARLDNGDRKRVNWILIDEEGNQVFSDTVTETFAVNSGDIVRTVGDKIGVFDTKKLKWGIEPIYPCLFKSVGNFYIASKALNQKGIIRSDGTVLLPFEYRSIQLLVNKCVPNTNCSRNEIIRWLAQKGESEIVLDQHGAHITSASAIKAYKMSLLFDDGLLFDPLSEMVRLDSRDSGLELGNSNEIQANQIRLFNIDDAPVYNPSRSFPLLECSLFEEGLSAWSLDEVRKTQFSPWSSFVFRDVVFDAIVKDWGGRYEFPVHQLGIEEVVAQKEISAIEESTANRMFREECANAQRDYDQYGYYNFNSIFYKIHALGERFVSIEKGYHGHYDERYMTMSQAPPPPPASEYMSFVERNGIPSRIELTDIFTSESLLLEEFIVALKLRDDLKLDCSNLENMIKNINGRFSLCKEGVYLYYPSRGYWNNQPTRFLIPLERLKLHSETNWIVPILEAER